MRYLPDEDDPDIRYVEDGLSDAEQAAAQGLPPEQLRRAKASTPPGLRPPRATSGRVIVVDGGGHQWVLFGGVETVGDGRLLFAFLPQTDGAPQVRLEMDDSGAHPVIGRLELLRPEGSTSGVTSETVRALPLARFLAAMRSYAEAAKPLGEDPAAVRRLQARLERLRKKEAPPRGPHGHSDAHYRRIALEYLALYRSGVTRGILGRIAEKEGRDPKTVRDWVHEARARGFLGPGTPGRAGAEPGPRLFAEEDQ